MPERIVTSLRRLGLQATWTESPPPHTESMVDGHLEVTWAGGQHTFPVVVKRTMRPSLVSLTPPPGGGILMTEHVTSGVAEALDRAGWRGYVDLAGNASLTAPGLVVRVLGRRPSKSPQAETSLPFARRGLSVTFALLVSHQQGQTPTQRALASLAGSSLATVNRVLQGLRALRYVNDDGKVEDPALLAHRWTEAYLTIQPEVWPSTFYSSARWATPLDIIDSELPGGCLISSELAAHRVGASIRPTTASIYVPSEQKSKLLKAGQLRRDPEGFVSLRPTFWNDALLAGTTIVPPLLMRADLLLEDDPRLLDLAHRMEPV